MLITRVKGLKSLRRPLYNEIFIKKQQVKFTVYYLSNYIFLPILGSVNLKSGKYFRSFALLAVFLNWPSDLLVSYLTRVKNNLLLEPVIFL